MNSEDIEKIIVTMLCCTAWLTLVIYIGVNHILEANKKRKP
jgi:hypothetical protein